MRGLVEHLNLSLLVVNLFRGWFVCVCVYIRAEIVTSSLGLQIVLMNHFQ